MARSRPRYRLMAIGVVLPFVVATGFGARTPLAVAAQPPPIAPRFVILSGVDMRGPNDGWAVGQRGVHSLAEHWDGTSWQRTRTPDPHVSQGNVDLADVAVVPGADSGAWAVGGTSDGRPIIDRWNGEHWLAVKAPAELPGRGVILTGVVAIAADDVWMVGISITKGRGDFRTLALHWDGRHVVLVPTPNLSRYENELEDVSASGANDVWAVGTRGPNGESERRVHPNTTLIEHWDGSQWSVVPSPNPGFAYRTLSGVSASGPDDAWAVGWCFAGHPAGQKSMTLHWDGTSWSVAGNVNPQGRRNIVNLDDVSAPSPGNTWTVGIHANNNDVNVYAARWSGTRWVAHEGAREDSSLEISGVSALAPDDVWIVGSTGSLRPKAVIEHWDGSTWTHFPG